MLTVQSTLDEVTLYIDPTDQDVPIGSTATINSVVYGPTPLSFQWNKNGTNIAGATNAALVIPNAQSTNSANYSYTATFTLGTLSNSSPSALRVYFAQPPVITGAKLTSPENFRITYTGLTNRYYEVDYATDLVPPVTWDYYTTSDILTTNPAVFDIYIPLFGTEPRGFFRVKILPPPP